MLKKEPPTLPPEKGACTGHPTEWWFPVKLRGQKGKSIGRLRENSMKAKAICSACDFKEECLEYSLHHEPLGIWGGLEEGDRALIRRRQNIYADRSARVFLPTSDYGRGRTRSSNPS